METKKNNTVNVELTKKQRKLIVACLNELMPKVLEKAQKEDNDMEKRAMDDEAVTRVVINLYKQYGEMKELLQLLR